MILAEHPLQTVTATSQHVTFDLARAAMIGATLLLLGGCGQPVLPPCDASAIAAPGVWVVDHGWHTDIGLPAAEATGKLAYFRSVFPGARTLMFGFGKRTFFTAKVETSGELVMGPFPGPGAIQVTGLSDTPAQAYEDQAIHVALSPNAAAQLADFLSNSLGQTQAGVPRLISEGLFPGSVFYGSAHDYNLLYTCNTWTADALAHAGIPVSQDVILAGTAMREVAAVNGTCRMPKS